MTPERWELIGQIFNDALELPESEREPYVRRACGDDPPLRSQVMVLLGAHHAGPMDRLAAAVGLDVQEALPREPAAGARIGPYRVVEPIGRGGMGIVYLAERDDPDLPQRVALKLVRGGIDGVPIMGSFLTERRILARLEHPNITRLVDGGVTPEGVPFFAMEHVDGKPIHRYCDDRRLTVRERLDLFLGVCDAMQYAHRHLVVHRDVKPSNILVTPEGTVKVLDFGIAKLLGDEETAGQTRTSHRWMTPEYASPEQVRGEPVTTATDVYALGVVLYELLTSRRPYEVESGSRHDLERAILESEPSKPSAAVSRPGTGSHHPPDEMGAARRGEVARLRRQLSGDLDTIVLKAMQKEPDRRYMGAGELADDIRRHLAGLPVRARPDTFTYRASRFVQRHKVGVATSAVATLAVLGGALATAWQARIALTERDRAQVEATKARQVSTFLVDLFESADPAATQGDSISIGTFLERGAERVERELPDQPAIQAEMLSAMGRAYSGLGRYDRARPLLERSLHVRRTTDDPAGGEVAKGVHDLAVLLHNAGELDAAQEYYEEAVSIRRTLVERGSGDVDARRDELSGSLRSLAALLTQRREFEEAERLYREAFMLAEAVYGDEHLETAMVLMGMSGPLKDRGDLAAAESVLVRAVPIIRDHHAGDHPDVYKAINNLAVVYLDQGRPDDAEPLFRETLEMRRRLYGDEHPDVATGMQNLGAVLREMGQTDEAAALYRQALATRRKLLGDDHPNVTFTTSALALLYHDVGDCETALPLFAQAQVGWITAFGPRHGLTLKNQGLLGHCLVRLGRYAEAESQLLESHAALDSIVGAEHRETRAVAGFLVELYEARGDEERAGLYRTPADTTGGR